MEQVSAETEVTEVDTVEADIVTTAAQETIDLVIEHSDELEMLPMALKDLSFVEVESSPTLNDSLEAIPDQMAFKIGTAADLVGVKPYVLRFWETEFEALHPKKSRKGQRAYSRRDIETAMIIKKLLYEDRFSIEGARARLRELRSKVKEDRAVHQAAVQAVEEKKAAYSEALSEMHAIQRDLARLKALL